LKIPVPCHFGYLNPLSIFPDSSILAATYGIALPHFLALPGTKAPTMKEDNTIMIKSRFYLHNAIKQIIKTNREDHTTIIFLNMLEATNDKREETSDLCRKIDEDGIGLRLGDE
jgi:hypothetical protein